MRGNITVYMIMLIAVIWGLFILFPTPSLDLNEDNAGFYLNLMEKLNITNTTINVSGANGSLESARLVSNETGEWIAGDVIFNDGNIVMNGSNQEIDGVDISVLESDFSSHEGDTDNPHEVTKTQVGLGDVENTALSTWGGSDYITNTGILDELKINRTTNNVAMRIYTNATGTPDYATGIAIDTSNNRGVNNAILRITDSSDTGASAYGGAIMVQSNNVNGTAYLLDLENDAGNRDVLKLRDEGTGTALYIDKNTNGNGMLIDCEQTSDSGGAGLVVYSRNGIQSFQDITNGRGLYVYRNVGTNLYPLAEFYTGQASDNLPTISIQSGGDTGPDSGALQIYTTNSNNDNAIYHNSGAKLTQTGTWINAPSYSWLKNTVNSSNDLDIIDKFRNLNLQTWVWKNENRCHKENKVDINGTNQIVNICLNNYVSDSDLHYGAYLDDMNQAFNLTEEGVNTQDWIGINQIAIKQLIEKVDSLENRLNVICKNNPEIKECYGG